MEREALNKRKRELYNINQERELNRKKKYRDNLSYEKKENMKAYQKLYREKKKAEKNLTLNSVKN